MSEADYGHTMLTVQRRRSVRFRMAENHTTLVVNWRPLPLRLNLVQSIRWWPITECRDFGYLDILHFNLNSYYNRCNS